MFWILQESDSLQAWLTICIANWLFCTLKLINYAPPLFMLCKLPSYSPDSFLILISALLLWRPAAELTNETLGVMLIPTPFATSLRGWFLFLRLRRLILQTSDWKERNGFMLFRAYLISFFIELLFASFIDGICLLSRRFPFEMFGQPVKAITHFSHDQKVIGVRQL